MSNSEAIDACLRVVSNRCRNIRKTIEKAKTWQEAAENGIDLNEEQLESVRSVPRKQAVLSELQEILKKQMAVVRPNTSAKPTATTNAKTKDAKGFKSAKEGIDSVIIDISSDKTSPKSSTIDDTHCVLPISGADGHNFVDGEKTSPSSQLPEGLSGSNADVGQICSELTDQMRAVNPSILTGMESGLNKLNSPQFVLSNQHDYPDHVPPSRSTHKTAFQNSHSLGLPVSSAQDLYGINPAPGTHVSYDSTVANAVLQQLEKKHSQEIQRIKTECIRAVLNLFHVTDFLKQPGSREALLAYFVTAATGKRARPLTSLDIDLVCYFNVMLTTPNGNVAHDEAVDVSTEHCLEYLKGSRSEAFKGTTYATLSQIVDCIARCPIMTDRGDDDNLTSQVVGDRLTDPM